MQSTDQVETNRELVEEMMAALNNHDANAVLAMLSDDIVFENTGPAPDGFRYTGKRQVGNFFSQFFSDSPDATFEIESLFQGDDHVAVKHRYSWSVSQEANDAGYVRGVTIYQVQEGKIAGMHAYVKG